MTSVTNLRAHPERTRRTLKGQGPGLVNVLFAKRKSDYTRGVQCLQFTDYRAPCARAQASPPVPPPPSARSDAPLHMRAHAAPHAPTPHVAKTRDNQKYKTIARFPDPCARSTARVRASVRARATSACSRRVHTDKVHRAPAPAAARHDSSSSCAAQLVHHGIPMSNLLGG